MATGGEKGRRKSRLRKVIDACSGFLACGIFAAFGLAMVAGTIARFLDARHWPEAPCTVVQTTGGARLEYTVDGVVYQSRQVSLFAGLNSAARVSEALDPPGTTGICYYSPSDPEFAILERGFSRGTLEAISFGLIFAIPGLCGLIAMASSSFRLRASERTQRAFIAAGIVLFLGPVLVVISSSKPLVAVGLIVAAVALGYFYRRHRRIVELMKQVSPETGPVPRRDSVPEPIRAPESVRGGVIADRATAEVPRRGWSGSVDGRGPLAIVDVDDGPAPGETAIGRRFLERRRAVKSIAWARASVAWPSAILVTLVAAMLLAPVGESVIQILGVVFMGLVGLSLLLLVGLIRAGTQDETSLAKLKMGSGLVIFGRLALIVVGLLGGASALGLFGGEASLGGVAVFGAAAAALVATVLQRSRCDARLAREWGDVPPVRLLFLWVFGGQHVGRMMISIGRTWSLLGQVLFLRGEGHMYGSGRSGLVRNARQLRRELDNFDSTELEHEYYPAHSVLCNDGVWKEAVEGFVERADLFLVDFSGFAPGSEGCEYELELLVASVPLELVLVVVDSSTDDEHLRKTLRRAWEAAAPGSPNWRREEVRLRLFTAQHLGAYTERLPGNNASRDEWRGHAESRERADREAAALFRTLCATATEPADSIPTAAAEMEPEPSRRSAPA